MSSLNNGSLLGKSKIKSTTYINIFILGYSKIIFKEMRMEGGGVKV